MSIKLLEKIRKMRERNIHCDDYLGQTINTGEVLPRGAIRFSA